MSDFFSGMVPWTVAIATLISVVACAAVLWVQASKKLKVSLDENINSTGHVWDQDLKELNNPMPRWWMGLFYITVVFALFYLVLFPGLAVYGGSMQWSSAGQYEAERSRIDATAAPLYAKFSGMGIEEIAHNPDAQGMGQRLFLNNCAQCHGSDARGSRGFPNLTDSDWLHGGSTEAIRASIQQGRQGMMPPMMEAVGGQQKAREVAQYVLSLSGRSNNSLLAQLGRDTYKNTCAACHGADGKGNTAIGAPNLSDRTWLYGGTEKAIVETIRKGRSGNMPAHEQLLTPDQVRVLAAYVWQMSNTPGRSAVSALTGVTNPTTTAGM
ncbi:MAG TPA: cytochrome-c oxidase, cbb3-type subunit III [Limnobacter sp.]|nr:cytochrome-c oxidase, cbb3-type subunit III [Limnobacter sp.]